MALSELHISVVYAVFPSAFVSSGLVEDELFVCSVVSAHGRACCTVSAFSSHLCERAGELVVVAELAT